MSREPSENEEARFAIIRQLNELETRLNQVASNQVDILRAIELNARGGVELCNQMLVFEAKLEEMEKAICPQS